MQYLSAAYPGIGFGISLMTQDDEHYMLANANMQLPENKADGFPNGEQIAKLESGDRFQCVSVFADVPEALVERTLPETKLIRDVIELIELIDAPSRLPAGRVFGETILIDALNGTEG
ncbi:hypothetical protein [Aliiroseovarius sp. F20344]|uniref:hypothetical protein n=1 Tax=Aliiroseovarius sp. F20344 TaxID=2926414 RepID=UPI001FF50297|nr:hypothetical protein [Aliiroseovarius sp. F20344]MCK0141505.1 hypothetical protein [Aliiroseovarius sp. F20344]